MIGIINKLYLLIFVMIIIRGVETYSNVEKESEAAKAQIQSIKARIKVATKKRKKIRDYFADIDKKKEEIEVVAAEIENLQKKLPSSISDAENISLIRSIAENFKIKNLDISPANEVNHGFYISRIYSFSAKATYLQFLLLLERLSDAERILNVSSFSLKRTSDKDKGRYEIVEITASVESYRYNDSHKEERGISDIEKKFKEKKKKRVPRKRRKKK